MVLGSSVSDKSERHSEHELLLSLLRNHELQIRTCIPARIISIDNDTRRAVVRVEVQKKHDNENVTIADIKDIPVWEYCSGDIIIGATPKAGQEGMLMVCDREIETWKIGGSVSAPNYARLHQITDSWFMPGLFSDPAVEEYPDKVSLIDCIKDMAEAGRDLALSQNQPGLAASFQSISDKLD